MSDAPTNNSQRSDLLKAYRKRNARGPAVKVNPTGGRGSDDTPFVLAAITENFSVI